MTRLFTFGKTERLTLKSRIDSLFNEGNSFTISPFKVIYLMVEQQSVPVQVLISVPKKKFRHAVDRNSLRRKIREAYRLHKHLLDASPGMDRGTLCLAFIYTGDRRDIPFPVLEEQMVRCLEQLGHLKQTGTDAQQEL